MTEMSLPMLDALGASGPIPGLESDLMLYGQFVGVWEGRVVVHHPDGSVSEDEAEVRFGWALEGRAIQDIWSVPSPAARKQSGFKGHADGIYGTTLRVYDPANGCWHITWIEPSHQTYRQMIGRKSDDGIVQQYTAEDGTLTEWRFTDITANAFHWFSQDSADGGKSWTVRKEYFLRRA